MKKYVFFFTMIIAFVSCKTEYERIRTSSDPIKMAKAADKYFKAEEFLKAQSLYEMVIPYYRGKEEAADIFYKYAYTHYELNEYILSGHYFKKFANTYLNSPHREDAMYMAAYSNYDLSPSAKLDQSYSSDAIAGFQDFINTYPDSKRVKEANELIAELRIKQELKAFNQGQLYLDMKQYEAAMVAFENMVQEYPDSKWVEEARYKSIIAAYDLAVNSIYDKQAERYQAVLNKITKFFKKFSRSKYGKELNRLKKNSNSKLKAL